ncbi:MAG: response regulator [Arcobacteraceae bacterium]|nr:response regulator [Arcobacteraceae bacterium]
MFKNITALYAEDEEVIREAISSLLGPLFKNLIIAEDGAKGLELFKEHQDNIDLIITDINMPKLNGLDMLDKIKDLSPFVPMLITTAHNDANFLHRAIDVGVTGYVNKPIDIRKLIEIIKKNILPIVDKKQLEEKVKEQQEEKLQSAKFTAIGQLSAGITHEINTPLTYIKATFEMMQYDIEDLEDSPIKVNMEKDAKVILDGIHRMENIISSMKEIASSSKAEKEEVNLYGTILVSLTMTHNKCKHISQVYLNGRQFTTLLDKDDEVFMVNVQKQRIEQVWIVIINNAMDELMKNGVFLDRRLDITIENTDDNKIILKFKDNAGGISNEIKDHLFEAFKSTKESSGMGVGLNVAQKIIYENDGTIRAYNEDNGAVFEIII